MTTRGALARYWREFDGPPHRGARVLHPLVSTLLKATWNIRVYRREVIPRRGPVILAANHTGLLDGPLLYAVVPRPVHALIKKEMFLGALGGVLRSLGQISVDRFAHDPAAVKTCLAVLDRGHVLGIYPEGTRGTGDFGLIKPGVAYLALCTGAPIVPVACLGARGDGSSVGHIPPPRSRIDVVFGRPIATESVAWPRRRDVVRELAATLRETLAEHVRKACALTGRQLPGPAVDATAEPGPLVPDPREASSRNETNPQREEVEHG